MLMSAATTSLPTAAFPHVTPIPTAPVGDRPSGRYDEVASDARIERTAEALRAHGIEVIVVPDRVAARDALLARLPPGAEILAVSSQTLESLEVLPTLEDPARFDSVRPRFLALRQEGRSGEMRKLGSSPSYVVGSVHAVTEEGQVIVASGSGSQLAPYAFGSEHVLWVVGAQKIVPDLETGIRRLNEYTFPKEDARARAAYGRGSAIAKLLIVSQEMPGRITMILAKANLGF